MVDATSLRPCSRSHSRTNPHRSPGLQSVGEVSVSLRRLDPFSQAWSFHKKKSVHCTAFANELLNTSIPHVLTRAIPQEPTRRSSATAALFSFERADTRPPLRSGQDPWSPSRSTCTTNATTRCHGWPTNQSTQQPSWAEHSGSSSGCRLVLHVLRSLARFICASALATALDASAR